MATQRNSNLYPPIVESTITPFIYNKSCTVYFSLSDYGNVSDIQSFQVVLNNQSTNMTCLNQQKYPAGLKIYDFNQARYDSELDRYSFTIERSDIAEQFTVNTYYKVQIRFSTVSYGGKQSDSTFVNSWLTTNHNNFSEWSSVALVKPISNIALDLIGLQPNATTALSQLSEISGRVIFSNRKNIQESETLSSYNIQIKDLTAKEDYVKTEELFPENVNEIHYVSDIEFTKGNIYEVIISITTNNGYEQSFTCICKLNNNNTNFPKGVLTAELEREYGRIKITYKPESGELEPNLSYVIRKSSDYRYKETGIDYHSGWEDLFYYTYKEDTDKPHEDAVVNKTIEDGLQYTLIDKEPAPADDSKNYKIRNREVVEKSLVWYDYLVEDGIYYEYEIQNRDKYGVRSQSKISEPVKSELDHDFLCGDYRYLRLLLNPSVSSYKHSVMEGKTETLGSKYPFITRNGNMDYRELQISGLISFNNDLFEEEQIIKDSIFREVDKESTEYINTESVLADGTKYDVSNVENLFIDQSKLYEIYNKKEVKKDKDLEFVKERLFREEVIKFLYNGHAKLWKSISEGNIVVRLTDISLSPFDGTGRMVYSFSATATEIDDYNAERCDYYNIQEIGKFIDENENNRLETFRGQLKISSSNYRDNTDIIKILKDKYKYRGTPDGYYWNANKITWLRVTVPDSITGNKAITCTINENNMLIPLKSDNEYDFGERLNITSFFLNPIGDEIIIDYEVEAYLVGVHGDALMSSYSYIMSQLCRWIPTGQSIRNIINNKHFKRFGDTRERVSILNKVFIRTTEDVNEINIVDYVDNSSETKKTFKMLNNKTLDFDSEYFYTKDFKIAPIKVSWPTRIGTYDTFNLLEEAVAAKLADPAGVKDYIYLENYTVRGTVERRVLYTKDSLYNKKDYPNGAVNSNDTYSDKSNPKHTLYYTQHNPGYYKWHEPTKMYYRIKQIDSYTWEWYRPVDMCIDYYFTLERSVFK